MSKTKVKIYLDTSVISHLEQPEKPIAQAATTTFWEVAMRGEYDLYMSDIVYRELAKTSGSKREKLIDHMSDVAYTDVTITNEIMELAGNIVEVGILPEDSMNDAIHIACALVAGCDYIMTWNFNHLANPDTNAAVRKVSISKHYPVISLIAPNELKGENSDETSA